MAHGQAPANAGGGTRRLSLTGITKIYPSVVANENIDLEVMPGEIHAVLGENGAGKSTLMKTIYGVVKPDAGEMKWEGQTVTVANPAHARELGIGMVFQHFSLFETLTVVENVALALPGKPELRELSERIRQVSERYGLPVDPRRVVHSLSVGERQRVEIIRCLLQTPKLLIMDEPTSVLTPQAVRKLFDTLRQLASEGCSILYISHKLDEIQELCHTATVLRGGKVSGHCVPSQESPESMARLMIGKDLPVCEHTQPKEGGEVRLRLAGLSHASDDPFGADLQDLHLEVHSGEIVGIAGVSGNGQRQLVEALIGQREPVSGEIHVGGKPYHASRGEIRYYRSYNLPEEPLRNGCVPAMSVAENMALRNFDRAPLASGIWLRRGAMRAQAERLIAEYKVKTRGPEAPIATLSGGNVQRAVLARELSGEAAVLVAANPVFGLDFAAVAEIHERIIAARNAGAAVLLVSEDLDELLELADRIVVMFDGRLVHETPAARADIAVIGPAMAGHAATG
jgi:simple sugar transport system ATP-binding protein